MATTNSVKLLLGAPGQAVSISVSLFFLTELWPQQQP